ncbi:hypothetical protein [Parasphingorhabdus pacifica]
MSITASAVAGLLVGAFIAGGGRGEEPQPVSQVSASVPAESTTHFVRR